MTDDSHVAPNEGPGNPNPPAYPHDLGKGSGTGGQSLPQTPDTAPEAVPETGVSSDAYPRETVFPAQGDGGKGGKLTPQDHRGWVGERAAMEGMQHEYGQILARFLGIHQELDRLTQMYPDMESMNGEIMRIGDKLSDAMSEAFFSSGDLESDLHRITSFITFMVNIVASYNKLQAAVGEHLNIAATAINNVAATLGMEPIYGSRRLAQETSENTYITGVGQRLTNIHAQQDCKGDWCVIHRPIPGPWDQWPTVWRGDDPFGMDIWRGFERLCVHGVGHTAVEHILDGETRPHGCCGLCPCSPGMAEAQFDETTGQLTGYKAIGD